ncbi:hypothetical protein KUL152_04940 [Tenacibaculum sp. KUL152]|nr:hypothetical protein KUL152_04940 [Tenacibaculum sp. KUL152]
MAKYRLSSAADQDFEELFEYGIDNFGLAQAKLYVDGLIIQFQSIAENPLHYQAVDLIRKGIDAAFMENMLYTMSFPMTALMSCEY